jgi:hypothetical protein
MDSLRGGGDRSPVGGDASGSDLARQAGLDDITGGRGGGSSQRAGLFDSSGDSDDSDSDDSGDDSGFDGGDSDTA